MEIIALQLMKIFHSAVPAHTILWHVIAELFIYAQRYVPLALENSKSDLEGLCPLLSELEWLETFIRWVQLVNPIFNTFSATSLSRLHPSFLPLIGVDTTRTLSPSDMYWIRIMFVWGTVLCAFSALSHLHFIISLLMPPIYRLWNKAQRSSFLSSLANNRWVQDSVLGSL